MKATPLTQDFSRFIAASPAVEILRIAIVVVVGLLLFRILASLVRRLPARGLTDQSRLLLSRIVFYSGIVIILVSVLDQLGVKLSALFGAAGIVGVAVGIASQTSLGNIISGFFLVAERTFQVGDVVTVGAKTGVVHSIDLLSIKLLTFDNLLVRIPNQFIIANELTNVTRYPVRRMDFSFPVSYSSDLKRVREVLLDVARSVPEVLEEPEPLLIFDSFGSSGINILFGVWFHRHSYVEVKNTVLSEIKARFDAAGIEIASFSSSIALSPQPIAIQVVGGIDDGKVGNVVSNPDAPRAGV